jgi:hypothetical protein
MKMMRSPTTSSRNTDTTTGMMMPMLTPDPEETEAAGRVVDASARKTN